MPIAIDRSIGENRRQLECVRPQNGGHEYVVFVQSIFIMIGLKSVSVYFTSVCTGILRCVHGLLPDQPACLSTLYRIVAMVSLRATGETATSLQ